MEWIRTIADYINWFRISFVQFWSNVSSVLWSIWDFFAQVGAILKAIRYWCTTLFSGIMDLCREIFEWNVFVNVWNAFSDLADYIGWPAVVFIASLFVVVIVRIWIWFAFKIMRLNVDYNTLNKHSIKANKSK